MLQQIETRLMAVVVGFLALVTYTLLTAVLVKDQGIEAAINIPVTATPFRAYAPIIMQGDKSAPPVMPDGLPSWGTPIAVSPLDGRIWVVNPDAGSMTVLDHLDHMGLGQPKGIIKLIEIAVGQEPWALAISPDGQTVYVVDRASGTLVVVDAHSYVVYATLSVGPELGAVALNPTGSRAYVTVTSADEVAVVDTSRLEVVKRVPVEPKPYGIAVTDDGDALDDDEFAYVTHFLALPRADGNGSEATDDGREGRVTVLDTGRHAISHQITLSPNQHGFPNLLGSITIAGNRAWLPQVRAAPDLPVGLTTTVFAAVSSLDLTQGAKDGAAYLPLNDQDIFGSPVNNPVAAIPAPDGKTLYIVLAGSDLVEVVDVSDPHQPRLVRFLSVGKNPRGMALSRDGRWGYVMNYLSRSVTVLDFSSRRFVRPYFQKINEIPVTTEPLEKEVLRGKILFNNASNRKLSQGSWISCASCHPDGGSDGVTWIFPDGPRQTPPIWNAGETLPWHWSAALDEPQDVEDTIHLIQHGLGLAVGADPPLLGTPNAARSSDLDALAAFMMQDIRVPSAPSAAGDIKVGRNLFHSAGCVECHGGPTWTISAMRGEAGTLDPDGNGMVDDVLRDVGTHNPRDVRGETGFDPPSLLGVGQTAPYLHDGSMPTLDALLASGHPNPPGGGNGLDEDEMTALVAFLRSIGPNTSPSEAP